MNSLRMGIQQALSGLALMTICGAASAVCTFDQFNTISNPDDPACRDIQLTYTENDNSNDNIALGYPPPLPVESLTAIDGFRTYTSLFARHQDLALTNESVTGSIVGQTLAGRDIWAYRIGDSDSLTVEGQPEPAVFVNGGIHAREWQSPEVLTEIFEQLVEKSGDGTIGQFLHDNLNVVLLPVLNIDGFIQTQNYPTRATADPAQPRDGRMRRKNMRRPAGGIVDESLETTGDSFYGVDLNRNSVHGYGLNNGSSADPVSLIYRGPAISSEPEIVALRAATALGPASRLRLGIDVHSFSAVYFTPRTGNSRRDAITEALATRMRAVTNFRYRYSPGPVGSRGIGSLDNYFAFEFQVPAYTLEIEPLNGGQEYGGTGVSHSGFVLPDKQIRRVRNELADTLLLGFFRQAGPAHVVSARIRDIGRQETVYEAVWQATDNGRELLVTTNKALIPGIQYELWLAFSKPMRWYDGQDLQEPYPGQNTGNASIVINSADAGAGFSQTINVDSADWLTDPGGAPTGYLRYRGDALLTGFSLPVATDVSTPTAASLQIDVSDLAGMNLDADPQTATDWSDGHWNGYEDSAELDSDTGGADCKLTIYFAPTADAPVPAQTTVCPAKLAATTPPAPLPSPATPGPPASGGGGGHALWLLPIALLALRRR